MADFHRDESDQPRPAAVAGIFYPAGAGELRATVDRLLAAARVDESAPPPRALIAPHAGYAYSGPVAATAFATLRDRPHPERVVVLGPSHRVSFAGLALPKSRSFSTPLGRLELDAWACQRLGGLPQVLCSSAAHRDEHSIEVELPFLQVLFPGFRLVPLVVGEASAPQVADALELVWSPATLVVVSSDLSHHQSYEEAQRLDDATARRVERLEVGLTPRQACGCRAVDGLLELARRRGLSCRCLDLRSSGDTGGTRDRVVGYGAFALA